MKSDTINILKEELNILDKAISVLIYSNNKCSKIGIKDNYDKEEMLHFDALPNRFSRASYSFIKALALTDKIDMEDSVTQREIFIKAERIKKIESAKKMTTILNLRNEIAGEYNPLRLYAIFKDVLEYSPFLIDNVNRLKEYCKRYE